jgi:KDO2-lipid IV(A) lauroyltransferase
MTTANNIEGLIKTGMHYGMRVLPLDWCSAIGAIGGKTAPARYKESDERARRVFRKLTPEAADPAWLDAAMGRLWRNIGRTMAEYSIIDRLWYAGRIQVEGLEHVDAARKSGRPTIVFGLHLGNWELMGPALVLSGYPTSSVYLEVDNPFELRIAIKVRERYGMGLVHPNAQTTRNALRLLQKNERIFGIYNDEFVRNRVHAPAFGRKIQATGNIAYTARLAQMTNALVIPSYCIRLNESARFKVTFLPPMQMVTTSDRDADVLENIRRMDAVIDPIIKANLDQWYYVLDLELDTP